jgi:chaperonin cofactor prefoldin
MYGFRYNFNIMEATFNPSVSISEIGTSVARSLFHNRSEHELLRQQVEFYNHGAERRLEMLEGKVDHLENRVDMLSDRITKLEGRFEEFHQDVNRRFDKIETRLDKMDARLDDWQPTMDALKLFLAKQQP